MTPQQPDHAPAWSWRKPFAGQLPQPWDVPQHTGGLCQQGFHTDCPQAPGPAPAEHGTCACDCHHTSQLALPIGAP